jgi:hypothetical protein
MDMLSKKEHGDCLWVAGSQELSRWSASRCGRQHTTRWKGTSESDTSSSSQGSSERLAPARPPDPGSCHPPGMGWREQQEALLIFHTHADLRNRRQRSGQAGRVLRGRPACSVMLSLVNANLRCLSLSPSPSSLSPPSSISSFQCPASRKVGSRVPPTTGPRGHCRLVRPGFGGALLSSTTTTRAIRLCTPS